MKKRRDNQRSKRKAEPKKITMIMSFGFLSVNLLPIRWHYLETSGTMRLICLRYCHWLQENSWNSWKSIGNKPDYLHPLKDFSLHLVKKNCLLSLNSRLNTKFRWTLQKQNYLNHRQQTDFRQIIHPFFFFCPWMKSL